MMTPVRSSELAIAPAQAASSAELTFLFCDIEGSVARWDSDRDAMHAALRCYDELVRDAIEVHGGRVFKTIGDAFCAVFSEPAAAALAALTAQRALAAHDFGAAGGLALRIALHCGEAEERDGDYFGQPLNRVARLLAVAHGGQVVLSQAAAEGSRDTSAPVELRDLGTHRLKDLTAPERVFALVAPDLRADFPPLRSLGRFDNNLPQQLTTLIHREAEVAALCGVIASARLATLTGAGGVGKTRVVLQAGAEFVDAFPDGVWLVDLAPHGSPEYVVAELASVLGVRERSDVALEDAILGYVKRKKLLLVFDNCEHLVVEVARVANVILRACPHVSIVASSREALGIAGERVYRLPSLAVPPRGALRAEDAAGYGAVALFAARASAVNRAFRLTDATASTIGDIVRRLDGIPLAIELAAARMNALSPSQLAARLDARFRLLAGGNRGALPRQQTMWSAIAWSYDLLSIAEQHLFRQLTIFANGCTLEAAIAIHGGTVEESAVVELLAALVSKSLVVFDASDAPRYRLLESIRQYGHDRLVEHEEAAAAAARHAAYVAAFARAADAAWETTPDLAWYARVDVELENVRTALEWSLERANAPLVGASVATALRPFWAVKAPVEGRRWLTVALPYVEDAGDPALRAAVLVGLAGTAPGRTVGILASLAESIAIYRELGDERGLGRALVYYGDALAWLGNVDEGERALEESLALHRRRGDERLIAVDLCALAVLERIRGALARSRTLFAQALTLFEHVQCTRGRGAVLANLADLELASGNAERSIPHAHEAQRAYRLLDDRARVAQLDCSLAGYYLALERYPEAHRHARIAVRPLHDANDSAFLVRALEYVAVAAAYENDFARASRLLGFTQRSPERERRTGAIEANVRERVFALLADRCEDVELVRWRLDGEALTADRAIEEALR